MSSFSDKFNSLYKKRKKQENENKNTESNNTQKSVSLGHGLYSSTDIAPVAENPNVISSKYTPTAIAPTVSLPTGNSVTGFDANKNKNNFGQDTINAVGGASVIATTPKVQEAEKWINTEVFDDGFQILDIPKVILGTGADLTNNAIGGVLEIGESVVDTGAYAVGGVASLFGADEFAEDTAHFIAKDLYKGEEVAKYINPTHWVSAGGLKLMGVDDPEDVSIMGEKFDSLAQSGGQLAGLVGLSALGVPAWLTTTTQGVSAFGGEVQNAFGSGRRYEDEGVSYGEAGVSALITAGAEILTEKISGGIKIGGKTLDEGLDVALATAISDKTVRTLSKLGVDMAGEGGEEVLSYVMSEIGHKMTYESEKDWFGENGVLSSEEAFESFVGGAILGGTADGIKIGISNHKGTDFVTGLKTDTEQKVVDKLYEDAIKEAQEGGQELSKAEKNEIYDNIVENLEKGYISTDVIEEVLGENSAEYKAYMDEVNKRDATTKEYEELGNKTNPTLAEQSRYNILEKTVDFYKNNPLDSLKSQASESVYNSIKDTKLAESYNEQARRKQKYEADISQYDDARKDIIQKAIDSGVLNNTRRTHEFVDFIAKISADKGVSFDFTNNTKLKESGFALNGKTVNGFVTKDGVTINMNAAKSLNSVVGHEVTHVLEGTEFYGELQSAIIEYAKSKGEYDSRRRDIWNLYKDTEGFDTKSIDEELTADLVGDYLFTDKDFVNSLSTNNRNVFQKIYDEIKYLCKVAVGTKEARELEKVKKVFEQAYKGEVQKNTANDSGVKYSITEAFTDSNGTHFDNAVLLDTTFFDGISPRNWGEKLREKVAERASDDPLIMPIVDENGNTTLLQFANPNDRVTKDGKSEHKVIDKLSSGSDNISKLAVIHIDEIVSVSDENSPYFTAENNHQWLDKNGWLHRNANVINQKNGNIYNLTFDIAKTADGRTILYATDGKIKKVGNVQVNSLKIKGSGQNSNSKGIIPQKEGNVKRQFTLSNSDGSTPKQYGFWNVFGEDIAYSPTQEDISKTETTTEEVAPIAEEISGTSSEMEQVAPEAPSVSSLADLAKQSRREELRGAYNDVKSGKQYITDGSFIAEFYTIDESIEQSENFPAKRVQEAIDTAFRRDTDVDYAIDTADITDGYIKVGNSIFDVKYVNAVVGAMENPEFSLSHVPGGVDALLVYGNNGSAVIMPVRAGDNVNIVYEAQKVDGTVDEAVDETVAPLEYSVDELRVQRGQIHEKAWKLDSKSDRTEAETLEMQQLYKQIDQITEEIQNALDEKFPEAIYNKGKGENGWGDVYDGATEALAVAIRKVNGDLWTAINEEIDNSVATKNPSTPMVNAMIAVQEDVRQDTITPMQGAQLLAETYKNGGVEALKGLYNPNTGNLYEQYINQAKQYNSVAPSVDGEQIALEGFAPVSEEQVNAMQGEILNSLTDADAPPEVDAPYYGETSAPVDPFENRDIKDVGNRTVKAYMYENPEVKPFFQEEANVMLGELRDTIKGERYYTETPDGNPNAQYGAESYGFWSGTSRFTSPDIEYLLDTVKMSYADIEKGLNAIIEDNGAENIAAAKKIEFVLNDRLLNGYQDMSGYDIPANQDYINLINEKQITEYNEEAKQRFFENADNFAPIEQNTEHITEAPMAPAADGKQISMFEGEAPIASVAEKYEAIRPQKETAPITEEAEPRMKRADNPNKAPAGMEERSWVETSTGSEAVDNMVTPDDIPDDVRYYQVKSNKKTLAAANARLEKDGYAKSREYFEGRMSERKLTVEDIALGERLIQEAAKAGDAKAVRDLIIDVSILGTELGQRVQALSMIRRLTPEGQLKALVRTVERGKAKGDKAFDGVEVTEDMAKTILDTQKEDGTFDQAELNAAVEDVKQQIADQMRTGVMDYINAWRYLSMLGNPKTHIRNMVSNVAMFGTRAVKNAIARTAEDIFLHNKKPTLNTEAPKAEEAIAPMREVMPAGTRVKAADRNNIGTIQSFNPNTGKYTVHFENNRGQNATVKLDANILKPLNPTAKKSGGKAQGGSEDIAPVNYRTKTWARSTDAVKAFAKQTTKEMESAIKGDTKYSEEGSIKAKRQIFKTKAGNAVNNFNQNSLEFEDYLFSKPAFEFTFREYLTANGIKTEADIKNNPELVEKAKDYALEEARKATFRQDSYMADKIREIENKNPALGMAVGSIMPFKKTPINIAKTGVAYSPLGFARNVYDAVKVAKGEMDASEAIDHLAQTLTGTSLTLIGFALASMGALNGAGEDDKEGKYDYQLGEQSYSFNFGGNTYSLSWLTPVSMPLFVGANAYEKLVEKEEWDANVVVDTLAQTLDPLSEMSFLSSLDDVLSSYDSGVEKIWGAGESMVQNYATQFIPTLSSQVAQTFDDTKRSTKASRDSSFKFGEETVRKVMYKIPGLRNQLEPTTDIWGNDVKQTENFFARGFEAFLSPASKRENISTAVDMEIKDLYMQTGKSEVIPSIPTDYINYDGVKYDMSAEDYTAYKHTYGQTAHDLLEELFDTETYKNATSEERADMVSRVYDHARDNAKKEYFDKLDLEFTNAQEDKVKVYKENPIVGAIAADLPVDEYVFSTEYPEKYKFFNDNGISYQTYKAADEDGKRAYTWAYENPEKYTMSKVISDDLMTYYKYKGDIYDIPADKDEYGKSISGSRKEKVLDYINNLDADYYEKIILFKSEYNADDTYNYEIIDYLNSRSDLSYKDIETILKELGFTVDSKGNIYW